MWHLVVACCFSTVFLLKGAEVESSSLIRDAVKTDAFIGRRDSGTTIASVESVSVGEEEIDLEELVCCSVSPASFYMSEDEVDLSESSPSPELTNATGWYSSLPSQLWEEENPKAFVLAVADRLRLVLSADDYEVLRRAYITDEGTGFQAKGLIWAESVSPEGPSAERHVLVGMLLSYKKRFHADVWYAPTPYEPEILDFLAIDTFSPFYALASRALLEANKATEDAYVWWCHVIGGNVAALLASLEEKTMKELPESIAWHNDCECLQKIKDLSAAISEWSLEGAALVYQLGARMQLLQTSLFFVTDLIAFDVALEEVLGDEQFREIVKNDKVVAVLADLRYAIAQRCWGSLNRVL